MILFRQEVQESTYINKEKQKDQRSCKKRRMESNKDTQRFLGRIIARTSHAHNLCQNLASRCPVQAPPTLHVPLVYVNSLAHQRPHGMPTSPVVPACPTARLFPCTPHVIALPFSTAHPLRPCLPPVVHSSTARASPHISALAMLHVHAIAPCLRSLPCAATPVPPSHLCTPQCS